MTPSRPADIDHDHLTWEEAKEALEVSLLTQVWWEKREAR